MVTRKTWQEFKDAGLIWWVNMILHTFGWVIVTREDDDGIINDVFPARTKFRGFAESSNIEGYMKVSQYLEDNAKELNKEAKA